jgi:hypothetical protein
LQNDREALGSRFFSQHPIASWAVEEARYRNRKAKSLDFEFSLFNKKAPIKQVNTVQAAQRPPEQA